MVSRSGIGRTTRVPSSMAASRAGIEYSDYVSPVLKVEELLHAHKNKHYQQWLKSQESAQRLADQRTAIEAAALASTQLVEASTEAHDHDQQQPADTSPISKSTPQSRTPRQPRVSLTVGSSHDAFVSIASETRPRVGNERQPWPQGERSMSQRTMKSISSFAVAPGSRSGSADMDGFESDGSIQQQPEREFPRSSGDLDDDAALSVATYGSANNCPASDTPATVQAVANVIRSLLTHVSVGVGVHSDPEALFTPAVHPMPMKDHLDLHRANEHVRSPQNVPPQNKGPGLILQAVVEQATQASGAEADSETSSSTAQNGTPEALELHRDTSAELDIDANANDPPVEAASNLAAASDAVEPAPTLHQTPTKSTEQAKPVQQHAEISHAEQPQAAGEQAQVQAQQRTPQQEVGTEEAPKAAVQATENAAEGEEHDQRGGTSTAALEHSSKEQHTHTPEVQGEVQATRGTSPLPILAAADTEEHKEQVEAQSSELSTTDAAHTDAVHSASSVQATVAASGPATDVEAATAEAHKQTDASVPSRPAPTAAELNALAGRILMKVVSSVARQVGSPNEPELFPAVPANREVSGGGGTPRRTLPATESAVRVTEVASTSGVQLSDSELDRVNLHVLKQFCQAHDQKRLPKIEGLWLQHKQKLWTALEKKHPGTTQKFIAAVDKLSQKLRARKAIKLQQAQTTQ